MPAEKDLSGARGRRRAHSPTARAPLGGGPSRILPGGGPARSPLAYKPDFDRVGKVWNAFWQGEVLERPPVWATVPRPGLPQGDLVRRYWHAVSGNFNYILDQVDLWLEGTEFLAESVPLFGPDFGPDQFAAFLGGAREGAPGQPGQEGGPRAAEFSFSDDSPETDWVNPVVDDWKTALPLRLDPENQYWKGMLGYSRYLAAHADGRYLLSVADLHSNMDALLALRGSEKLCMDLYDCPELIELAMKQVRALYAPVYDALYAAGAMGGGRGSGGWAPFWSEGKFATIQCDFLALLSPELSRRYVLPALEEEAAFLDHCVYHLDGPGCLPHLDDILAIKDIDVIQWVPGAGKPPMHEWVDVLLKCQAAGKGLQLYDIHDLATVQNLARTLSPEKIMYVVEVGTREEVLQITDWLERNT